MCKYWYKYSCYTDAFRFASLRSQRGTHNETGQERQAETDLVENDIFPVHLVNSTLNHSLGVDKLDALLLQVDAQTVPANDQDEQNAAQSA